MPTKRKAEEPITEEARELLKEAARLEAATPTLEAQAVLGEVPEFRLRQHGERIRDLRARAEAVMTPEKLRATQEENARIIREREETEKRMRLGEVLRDALLTTRREEYWRLGVMPSEGSARGGTPLPMARVLAIANAAEEMISGMAVCGEDQRRQVNLVNVYGAGELLAGTYDEACREYLGRGSIEERDEGLDRSLGIALDPESGTIVDAAAREPTAGEEGPDAA